MKTPFIHQLNRTLRGLLALALALALAVTSISAAAGETVRYIHTDHLGTPIAVTDENGNVVERYEYEPYGLQTSGPVEDGPGYTGHVEDATTGLTYMQQRYYDPQIGMFLSVDPVTAYGNPVGQFNRYRYANGNPYKYLDPDGRKGEWGFPGVVEVQSIAATQTVRAGEQAAAAAAAEAVASCPGSHGCRQQVLNTGAAVANTVAVGALVVGQAEVTVVAGAIGKALSGAAYVDKLVSGTATASDHVATAIDAATLPGTKAVVSQFGEAGGEALKVIETAKDAVIATKDVVDAYTEE